MNHQKAIEVLRNWLAVLPDRHCSGCGICDRRKAITLALEVLEREARDA